MDKRIHSRHALKNVTVDISDGKGFYGGIIHDISRSGMQINNVSSMLDTNQPKYIVVVNAEKKTFKLSARLTWVSTEGSVMNIGIELFHPTWEWKSFVMDLEKRPDNIWRYPR